MGEIFTPEPAIQQLCCKVGEDLASKCKLAKVKYDTGGPPVMPKNPRLDEYLVVLNFIFKKKSFFIEALKSEIEIYFSDQIIQSRLLFRLNKRIDESQFE